VRSCRRKRATRSPESEPDRHLLSAASASRHQEAGDICTCDEKDCNDSAEEYEPDLLRLSGQPYTQGRMTIRDPAVQACDERPEIVWRLADSASGVVPPLSGQLRE